MYDHRALLLSALALLSALTVACAATGAAGGGSQGLTAYAPGEEGDQPPRREAAAARDSADIRAVIGVDDRTQITDTEVYPWRAIAYLEMYRDGAIDSLCTGTFVGPDALITAAHCLYDPVLGWVEDIAVVPGKNGLFESYGFEWASNWWVPDAWISTGGSPDWDWGVIKLP
ncbi:MAG: trypsin-like serine protease, partial [Chloroflexi bacterium]|nr:trypsin-like serine protease [Chloroflexota bacterium]